MLWVWFLVVHDFYNDQSWKTQDTVPIRETLPVLHLRNITFSKCILVQLLLISHC